MAALTRLRLEYNEINVALFYSQPVMSMGSDIGLCLTVFDPFPVSISK